MTLAISSCQSFSANEPVYILGKAFLKSVSDFREKREKLLKERTLNLRSYHFALCTAASKGNVSVVEEITKVAGKALLKYGDSIGWTPLIWAVVREKYPVIKWLLLNDDVNRTSCDGKSPLWFAVAKNKIPYVKMLLKYGAIVNPQLNEKQMEIVVKAKSDLDYEINEELSQLKEIITCLSTDTLKIVAEYYVD